MPLLSLWSVPSLLGQAHAHERLPSPSSGYTSGAWCSWLTVDDGFFFWLVQLVFLLSYKKTQETLSQAGQKTSAALSTVGSAISRKLGDMR